VPRSPPLKHTTVNNISKYARNATLNSKCKAGAPMVYYSENPGLPTGDNPGSSLKKITRLMPFALYYIVMDIEYIAKPLFTIARRTLQLLFNDSRTCSSRRKHFSVSMNYSRGFQPEVHIPQGCICPSEEVHLRLAVEQKNIFTYCLFPNIYTYISEYYSQKPLYACEIYL